MKKIFLTLILFTIFNGACYAFNIGTYKTDTEYGLIDGFKLNFGKKNDGEKFIQLKSETAEEIKRLEREKLNPPKKNESYDYDTYRFIQQNTVPF